jgi:peptidoglycan/LPS O-acetylase OafA/YrhL
LQYRRDIDGLRAVAVMAVVAYHTGFPGWQGGFIGVDVFFVVSGFLITSILLKELHEQGRIDFAHFYARRIRRILPNLILVTSATLVAALVILSPGLGELQSIARSAIAAITMVANFYFLSGPEGYFASPSQFQPLLHTWSLSVEEQFYLIWPALMLLSWMLVPYFARPRKRLALIFALVILASFFASSLLASCCNGSAFFLAPARAWELALGGLIALGLSEPVPVRQVLGSATAVLGLCLIAIAAHHSFAGALFPTPLAAIPTIGTALVILGNAWSPKGPIARLLSIQPLVTIGLASYAWYLWHWPMLSLARVEATGEPNLVRDGSLSLLSLGLSVSLLNWFENPMRFAGRKWLSDARVIAFGGAATCAALLLAGAVGVWANYDADRSPAERMAMHAKAHTERQLKCGLSDENDATQTLGPCLASSTVPRVLLWGDSFAGSWSPPLDAWSTEHNPPVEVEFLSKAGCPPLLGALPNAVFVTPWKGYQACHSFNGLVGRRLQIAGANGSSGVLLAANWLFYANPSGPNSGTQSFDISAIDKASSLKALEVYLHKSLHAAEVNNLRTLIVLQSPWLAASAPECLYRRSEMACSISLSEYRKKIQAVNHVLENVAADFKQAKVFDPMPYLCSQNRCGAMVNGVVAYSDANHLTASMSRSLVGKLQPYLDWLVERDRSEIGSAD